MNQRFRQLALISSVTACLALVAWLSHPRMTLVCRPSSLVKSVDIVGLVPRPLTEVCLSSPWSITGGERRLLESLRTSSEHVLDLVAVAPPESPMPAFSVIIDQTHPQEWSLRAHTLKLGSDLLEDKELLTKALLRALFAQPHRPGPSHHELFADLYEALISGQVNGHTLLELWDLKPSNMPWGLKERSSLRTLALGTEPSSQLRLGLLMAAKQLLVTGISMDERRRLAESLWRISKIVDLPHYDLDDEFKIQIYLSRLEAVSRIVFGRSFDFTTELMEQFKQAHTLVRTDGRYALSHASQGFILDFSPSATAEIWIEHQPFTLKEISASNAKFVFVVPKLLPGFLDSTSKYFQGHSDLPVSLLSEQPAVSAWSPESARLALRFGVPANLQLPKDSDRLSPKHRSLLGLKSQQVKKQVLAGPIQALMMVVEDKAYVR